MNSVPIFREWESYRAYNLASVLHWEELQRNTVVCSRGFACDKMFFVFQGKIDVIHPDSEVVVTTIEKYGYLGESGMIQEKTRRKGTVVEEFDCVCATNVHAFTISRENFSHFDEPTISLISDAFVSKNRWRHQRVRQMLADKSELEKMKCAIRVHHRNEIFKRLEELKDLKKIKSVGAEFKEITELVEATSHANSSILTSEIDSQMMKGSKTTKKSKAHKTTELLIGDQIQDIPKLLNEVIDPLMVLPTCRNKTHLERVLTMVREARNPNAHIRPSTASGAGERSLSPGYSTANGRRRTLEADDFQRGQAHAKSGPVKVRSPNTNQDRHHAGWVGQEHRTDEKNGDGPSTEPQETVVGKRWTVLKSHLSEFAPSERKSDKDHEKEKDGAKETRKKNPGGGTFTTEDGPEGEKRKQQEKYYNPFVEISAKNIQEREKAMERLKAKSLSTSDAAGGIWGPRSGSLKRSVSAGAVRTPAQSSMSPSQTQSKPQSQSLVSQPQSLVSPLGASPPSGGSPSAVLASGHGAAAVTSLRGTSSRRPNGTLLRPEGFITNSAPLPQQAMPDLQELAARLQEKAHAQQWSSSSGRMPGEDTRVMLRGYARIPVAMTYRDFTLANK